MNIVGILLAASTVATLIYAAYVMLKERYSQPSPAAPENPPAPEPLREEPVSIMPFVSSEDSQFKPVPAEKKDTFEDFVAARFDQKYFSRDNTDVFTDFALHVNPDLTFVYADSLRTFRFAVECKFRPSFSKENSINISSEQLDSYRFYQSQNNIPVFIILGIGGTPCAPEKLFIVPLSDVPAGETSLQASFLARYRKFGVKTDFFFHPDLKVLR